MKLDSWNSDYNNILVVLMINNPLYYLIKLNLILTSELTNKVFKCLFNKDCFVLYEWIYLLYEC